MKKSIILSILLTFILTTSVFAGANITDQDVTLDGEKVEIAGYNINGNNYFKLRDIAALLSGTEAEFDVSYNSMKNSVEITRNAHYEKLPTDLTKVDTTEINSKKSSQKVYLDKEHVVFSSYSINNNNYFKLRDLGKTIGFYVDFDEKSNTIIVKSEKTTPKDLIETETVSFKSFATDVGNNITKYEFDKKEILTPDDFIKQMQRIVLLSKDERQFSGKAEYNESNNTVEFSALGTKIKGKIYFDPKIKVEQGNKKDFFDFNKSINVNELIKDFSKDENLTITMGYYLGDEKPENFRSISTIEFTNTPMGIE